MDTIVAKNTGKVVMALTIKPIPGAYAPAD